MKTKTLARCALLAALMCICSWISIPAGDIAVTLQTFSLFLTLCLLGRKYGTLVCLIYLLLGIVGLPVFAGFRGGMGAVLGATGGYILGFLAAAVLYWGITALLGQRLWVRIGALLLGLCACYAFGTVWYLALYLRSGSTISVGAVVLKCVVPYLLPDLFKLIAGVLLGEKLKRFLA